MKYVLFNPLANNNRGEEALISLENIVGVNDIEVKSIINLDLKKLVSELNIDDDIYLVGGDGTLNCFINLLDGKCPNNNVYFYAAGSGNDFYNDIGIKTGEVVLVNPYLTDLPKVTIDGKSRYFINNVGYGIDGYVCEVADEQKKKSEKKINYTMIALMGLLFHYKRKKARVIIDGEERVYENVWFSPAMNGKYYGGGMMVAPMQDRKSGVISNVVFHCANKLKTLLIFPKIFTGKHIKYSKNCDARQGKRIEVFFDEPCALQIDGETVLGVTHYIAEV